MDSQIVLILGFLATLIGVITPIIKLNATITKLNTTLDHFQETTKTNHDKLEKRVSVHGTEIDDLTARVVKLEHSGKEN